MGWLAVGSDVRPGADFNPPYAALLAIACTLLLAGAGLTIAVETASPPLPMAVAGGLGLMALLALALARFDAAVGLGFLLMAVVRVEPAPPDAIFAVIFAIAAVTGRFNVTRAPMSATAATASILLLTILSMTYAVDTMAALRYAFITIYLGVLALWIVGWLDRPGRARIIVLTWLFGGVVSAVLTSISLNTQVPFRDLFITEDLTRGRGLFKDPNVYAPFLVPIAVILLQERLSPKLLKLRGSTSAILFALLALGILFGYSRAAWANFLIATLITLFAVRVGGGGGGRRAARTLISMVVVGMAVLAAISATGSLDFLEQRAQLQWYDTERFGAQAAGFETGFEYPVGVGPGQWRFYRDVETHSTYVRVTAEQGLLGLASWIALLISTLILALRNVTQRRDTYGIGAAALLGSWCGIIFNSFVVDTLHWRHVWVVAGLIWAGAVVSRRQNPVE